MGETTEAVRRERPDSPAQLSRPEWRVVLTRTAHEFRIHQCWDLAAALTYHAVLSVCPALLTAAAFIGMFGSAEPVAKGALDVVVGSEAPVSVVRSTKLWLNDGQGNFTDVSFAQLPPSNGELNRKIALADIDPTAIERMARTARRAVGSKGLADVQYALLNLEPRGWSLYLAPGADPPYVVANLEGRRLSWPGRG